MSTKLRTAIGTLLAAAGTFATRPNAARRKIKLAATVVAASFLGGCVVGPDYEQPWLALPANWGNSKHADIQKPPALAHWWRRLGDPLLDDLVAEAVDGNLDVATSKARIREARATYRQTVGALFPAADGNAALTRGKSDTGVYTQYQAGLDASWEIDLFGANRRAMEAALYGMDAAEEELRATLLTLIGDITTNYVEARGYQARLALARRTAKSQRETAEITRTKFEAGASSAVDVANATGQATTTEANIPALEAAYAAAVHRLSVLTGRPPAALMKRLRNSKPIPSPRLPIPTGIPADVLLTRPDVRLAERQYAQATARIGEAEAARYPAVSLTGNINTSSIKLGDLARTSSVSWNFGPSLTVPIFNAGQLREAVHIAEAQRDQYFLTYRSSVLTALEDVENAIVSLAQERIRKAKLASATEQYRKAASLARSLYRSGTQSFLDLLEAERSLYSAEDALIESRISIATDYIALNKALGGGWTGAIDASMPEVVDVNTRPHSPPPEAHPDTVALSH